MFDFEYNPFTGNFDQVNDMLSRQGTVHLAVTDIDGNSVSSGGEQLFMETRLIFGTTPDYVVG